MNQKSGGLAGIVVGASAISTVGKEGLGLTYRGYDIHDLTHYATFEEVAYLLIYGKLPNEKELTAYYEKLFSLREIPQPLKNVLENIPATAHPMDVLRTGCSMLGTIEQENANHTEKDIADRLLACTPGMLLYWYHFHKEGKRIPLQTNEHLLASHFLHLLHGKRTQTRQANNCYRCIGGRLQYSLD